MHASSFILTLLVLGAVVVIAGCVDSVPPAEDDRLVVAVSLVPEETFVKSIAGDVADVLVMIPSGYSPETYDLTPQQMQQLARADVYFAIGVPSEAAILSSLNSETLCVSLQDAVSEVYSDLEMNGGRDPHIWLSPKRAVVMVKEITAVLSALDDDHASQFQQNAEAYVSEITAASAEATETLKSATGKTFITTHPAFGYFADEYGLVMQSLEEDGKEATIQHMQALIDLAKEKKITTVFYQKEVGTVQATALAEEIGGTISPLSPLDADYTENIRKMATAIAEAAR